MKPLPRILIFSLCCVLTGCGKGLEDSERNSPAVMNPEATFTLQNDASHPIEMQNADPVEVVAMMLHHSPREKTQNAIARSFDQVFTIHCQPTCTIKKR